MKLILEAIKALFRGMEAKIPKSLSDLLRGEKIPGHMVQDMYYFIPAEYEVVHEAQEYALEGPLDDEYDNYVRNDQPTYGVEIRDYIPRFNANDTTGYFTVDWDGIEYQCKPRKYYGVFTLGNGNVIDSDENDTGEPFCILVDVYERGDGMCYIRSTVPGVHIMKFGRTIKAGQYQSMPRKFLPDGIEKEIAEAKQVADNAKATADAAETDAIHALEVADNANRRYDMVLELINRPQLQYIICDGTINVKLDTNTFDNVRNMLLKNQKPSVALTGTYLTTGYDSRKVLMHPIELTAGEGTSGTLSVSFEFYATGKKYMLTLIIDKKGINSASNMMEI